MGARAVASVVLTFGMVSVGIKLFLSAKGEQVGFNMINPATGNRVGQKLFDKETGDEVSRGDTVKGYEHQKGSFVTFTDEEISNMQAEKRDTLDVAEFVPVSEIDPLHVEKTFYTGPDKGMDRQYELLFQTLKNEGKAAVGTWVARGKEHLVTIRAYEHGLIIHQMFYDSEVRSFEARDTVTLSAPELAMGKMLVDQFAKEEFDKSQYRDRFAEKLQAAVKTKLDGGKITAAEVSSPAANMAESLKASLKAMGVPDAQIETMLAQAAAEAPAPAPAPAKATKKKAPAKKAVKKTAAKKKTTKKAANG